MKKIDLHIHTISTPCDSEFSFSQEKLLEYIDKCSLDIIGITNHNCFNIEQYNQIKASTKILVLPGIEVDIENGHLLVFADPSEVIDFESRCEQISKAIPDKESCITILEFKSIFPDLSRYILIPHYDKSPCLPNNIIDALKPSVTAGEVASPKKFIYCIKDESELVPVFFSDIRVKKDLTDFPVRQTFVDIGEVSFSALKYAFSDKNKVSLSSSSGHGFFQATNDGLVLSTGLNIIIGERSSGKSFTLNKLYKTFEHVKYIKQFSLIEKSDKEDSERFNTVLRESQSLFIQNFLKEFKDCVDDVIPISIEDDDRAIANYLSSLFKHAQELEKADAFSKATIFSETEYPDESNDSLRMLISSVITLAENTEYKQIIEKYIELSVLKELAIELMEKYSVETELVLKHRWINDLLFSIKSELQRRTAATPIPEIDFFAISMNRLRVKKFNDIALAIRKEKEIYAQEIQSFKIAAKTRPFTGAGELKAISGRQLGFSKTFAEYSNPYGFLKELKLIEGLPASEYYRFFTQIEYKILNRFGFEVSGGERSEFRLLQEISDALQFDLLLIDEPESSFDNIFLDTEVNQLIKNISRNIPVVLVTHNNTVGASIRPDYLIYTKRVYKDTKIYYHIFTGHPTDKYLRNINGETKRNFEVILNCLEAGLDTYNERGITYETLKN